MQKIRTMGAGIAANKVGVSGRNCLKKRNLGPHQNWKLRESVRCEEETSSEAVGFGRSASRGEVRVFHSLELFSI